MSRYPKIPRQVTLPFGYKIKVRKLSNRRLTKLYGPTQGLWIVDGRTRAAPGAVQGEILLNSDCDYATQIETLAHELLHAVNDWGAWLVQAYANPFRIELGQQVLDEEGEE